MTKKQAITDSLIKWGHAKNTGCDNNDLEDYLEENHERIFKYLSECGLCEKHDHYCAKCILYKKWGVDCTHEKSLYYKWSRAETTEERIKYATMIYNDIESLL